MRILITLTVVLLAALPLTAQSYIVGANIGVGTMEDIDENRHNFDTREFMAGWFTEDDTILNLRLGQVEEGSDVSDASPELDYFAVTVDYLFYDKVFTTGFFLGPAYYDGEVSYAVEGESGRTIEDENLVGAIGGIETFFPLSRRLELFFQVSGHYLPLEREAEILLGFSGGLTYTF